MRYLGLVIFLSITLSSCIDEDLSKCTRDLASVDIVYTVKFDEKFADVFGNSDIYTIHSGLWNDMSLYDEVRLSKEDIPSDLIFHYSVPQDEYIHIVTANASVDYSDCETPYTSSVSALSYYGHHLAFDTIEAASCPVFSGLCFIANDTCHCESHLYEVVLRPVVSRYKFRLRSMKPLSNVRVVVSGSQSAFKLYDSVFVSFPTANVLVPTYRVNMVSATEADIDFYTFPILPGSRHSAEALKFQSNAEMAKWYVSFWADVDGKTIKNKYVVYHDLYAGEVFDRSFVFYTDKVGVESGVEVDLDWRPGSDMDEEI